MRPTTLNLLIAVLTGMAAAVIGGLILRYTAPSTLRFRIIRIFAAVLIAFAYLLVGSIFFEHVSGKLGRDQVWFRAPTFYLSASFLLGSMLWWFRRPRTGAARDRSIRLLAYPVILAGTVFGLHWLAYHQQEGRLRALETAVASAQNQPAPEFAFLDLDGRRHALSEFKGRLVLLNFWATTCGPCLAEMPDLSALQEQLAARNFAVVYLSLEEPEVLAEFFRRHTVSGVKGRLTPELRAPDFYQAGKAWPISFLVSPDGVVKDTWIGAPPPDWLRRRVEREL